jgi:murein L,D-transpeptidase YafK
MGVERRAFGLFRGWILAAAWLGLGATGADAVTIELKDVAADRIERQRRAIEGHLPLAGTPDLSRFGERLAEAGLKAGDPVLIRIFKAESELEVWMRKDDKFVLFATYPVCHWSGTLGPKVREGDKQAPEGFYTITRRQLHLAGRWPRALNLGFPNVFDKSLARTGNYILIHGGCSSVGCFAMTNTVIEEVFRLTTGALAAGETYVPVHVFPFRMTSANLARHEGSEWRAFWANLKEGYDAFERTRLPPRVSVCDGKYQFQDLAPGEVGGQSPLGWCGATAAALSNMDRWYAAARLRPSSWLQANSERISRARAHLVDLKRRLPQLAQVPSRAMMRAVAVEDTGVYERAATLPAAALRRLAAMAPNQVTSTSRSCSPQRASCRKHLAMIEVVAERKRVLQVAAARKRALQLEGAVKEPRRGRSRTATRH